jgi:putative endopeptidase
MRRIKATPVPLEPFKSSDYVRMPLEPFNPGQVRRADGGAAIHGIQPDWIDRAVDPRVDFYNWATGSWDSQTQIPADEPAWGPVYILHRNVRARVRDLIYELSAIAGPDGSEARKVGDFFASAMDEPAIEAAGHTPLRRYLRIIDRTDSRGDLPITLAHLHGIGVRAFFSFGSVPDLNDSSHYAAVAGQSGLGLGDRDYYLTDAGKNPEIRQKYVAHIARMFALMGDNQDVSASNARDVMELEAALAAISMPREDARNPGKVNHPMATHELMSLMSAFNLQTYFFQMGTPAFDKLIVLQPDFFRGLDQILKGTPFSKIKVYLKWHLISRFAGFLSSGFVDENFDFFNRTLNGQQVPKPRWEVMVEAANDVLGEALGKVYAERFFPPQAKARMNELAKNLLDAAREAIESADWMGDETRKHALLKLSKIEIRVGYPDQWIDYSNLEITRDSLVANYQRAALFQTRRDLDKIGKPIDRTEWHILPHTVNAYFNPFTQQLTFTAGFLQPPFFDMDADDASIYASVGAVIAHELTHAFDKNGSQFDAAGNIRMWFTAGDLKGFEGETAKLVRQYSAFSIPSGKHLKGEDVVGEAAADLGGARIAFRALQKVLDLKGRTVDASGLTDDMRFFIAYAQGWAEKRTAENLEMMVSTNEHPPGKFRCKGTLANMPEFPAAFGWPDDVPMMLPPETRCRIWSTAPVAVAQG